MGKANGTSISTNHLAYGWKVEMKMWESIKEGGNEIMGIEREGKKKGETI